MNADNIFIYEDHARITILDDRKRQQLSAAFLQTKKFEEVVLGLEELCLKFNPEFITDGDIKHLVIKHINDHNSAIQTACHHQLHMSLDSDYALDKKHILDKMDMDETEFRNWFLRQKFRVEMMGFQPGFAYLSHDSNVPEIERLDIPRARVAAGSIGFLGTSACIYAHDGPGGWPIIGRVNSHIFNTASQPPNLLQNGDHITFTHD